MQIVRDLGGYSYGRSDLVRRAMSKKKMDVMLKEKENFVNGNEAEGIDGCAKRGVPKEAAEEIFNQMISFAEYAFNKSHAAAYAVVAYQTAFLKCYYPVEFMAALMTSVIGDSGQIAKYIRNCHELGIEVLPPSVLESRAKFTVKDGKIRFGLLAVKGVGEGPIKAIIKARETKGLPKDIFQFISDIEVKEINKKAIEGLIKAGAFDELNPNRAQYLAVHERLIESAQGDARKNVEGQLDIFSMAGISEAVSRADVSATLPDVQNFSKDMLLQMEKEMMGIYITDHPLKEYVPIMEKVGNMTTDELAAAGEEGSRVKDGMKITLTGMVSHRKSQITKSSKMMAFLDIEDLYGSAEIVVFPNVFERYQALTEEGSIVAITGTVNFKEEKAPSILADKIVDLRGMEMPRETAYLRVEAPDSEAAANMIRGVLEKYPGEHPVKVYLTSGGGFQADKSLWVDLSPEFKAEMAQLLGEENVKYK